MPHMPLHGHRIPKCERPNFDAVEESPFQLPKPPAPDGVGTEASPESHSKEWSTPRRHMKIKTHGLGGADGSGWVEERFERSDGFNGRPISSCYNA